MVRLPVHLAVATYLQQKFWQGEESNQTSKGRDLHPHNQRAVAAATRQITVVGAQASCVEK
jgi:hypothetical protein